MTKCFFLMSFVLLHFLGISQATELNYYDEHWKTCQKQDAYYIESIETIEWNDFDKKTKSRNHQWEMKIFLQNGELLREGRFKNGYFDGVWKYYEDNVLVKKAFFVDGVLEGEQVAFHSNGNVKSTCVYQDGMLIGEYLEYYSTKQLKSIVVYINDKKEGEQKFFFEDGSLKSISLYKEGKNVGPNTSYYQSGEVLEEKIYVGEERYEKTQFYKSGIVRSIEYSNNSHKDSMFVYYPSGKLLISEHYDLEDTGKEFFYLENGEVFKEDVWVKGERKESKNLIDTLIQDTFNEDRFEISSKENLVYTIVEEMPRFKGTTSESIEILKDKELSANEGLMKYLAKIEYPEYAVKYKIETKVYLRFLVVESGDVKGIDVAKSIYKASINSEYAFRHIEVMPKWVPGYQRGKAVTVQFIVPLNFKMN